MDRNDVPMGPNRPRSPERPSKTSIFLDYKLSEVSVYNLKDKSNPYILNGSF